MSHFIFFSEQTFLFFSIFEILTSDSECTGVDLVGVEIIKNNPTATGGPGGGRPCPPRPAGQIVGVWVQPILTKTVKNTIYCQWPSNPGRTHFSTVSMNNSKKPKFTLEIGKNVKKHKKSSEWRHIHRIGLRQKSAAQKYQFLIFRTNEGDFGGTPVKNQ